MNAIGTRVRDDRTGREGTVIKLDGNYRAGVNWDDGNPEPVWISRRNLIILCSCGRQVP